MKPKKSVDKVASPDDVLANFDRHPDSALVDVKVVAKLFGCHQNTVWNQSKSGVLPAPLKITPYMVRWRVGDLRAHMGVAA